MLYLHLGGSSSYVSFKGNPPPKDMGMHAIQQFLEQPTTDVKHVLPAANLEADTNWLPVLSSSSTLTIANGCMTSALTAR
jgi:hypothetical protein